MNKADSYINEITRLDQEIKRLHTHLKKLKDKKKLSEKYLLDHMKKYGIDSYHNLSTNKLEKKFSKIKRKKESEKKRDAIQLFREIGVPDPDSFYFEFKKTQKYHNQD